MSPFCAVVPGGRRRAGPAPCRPCSSYRPPGSPFRHDAGQGNPSPEPATGPVDSGGSAQPGTPGGPAPWAQPSGGTGVKHPRHPVTVARIPRGKDSGGVAGVELRKHSVQPIGGARVRALDRGEEFAFQLPADPRIQHLQLTQAQRLQSIGKVLDRAQTEPGTGRPGNRKKSAPRRVTGVGVLMLMSCRGEERGPTARARTRTLRDDRTGYTRNIGNNPHPAVGRQTDPGIRTPPGDRPCARSVDQPGRHLRQHLRQHQPRRPGQEPSRKTMSSNAATTTSPHADPATAHDRHSAYGRLPATKLGQTSPFCAAAPSAVRSARTAVQSTTDPSEGPRAGSGTGRARPRCILR